MKIFKKNIALIMLFVMIGNFFIAPICDVYAESSSEVETYITTIDENVNSIKEAISIAKLGKDYLSDRAYIYAVDRLESEASSVIESYNTQKLSLGTIVSLEKLLTDSNSSYLEDYNNYFTSDMILTLSNINDVEYSAGELNKVIYGEELALLVKDTYLKDHFNKISDLSNNYGKYIEDYKNLYDENNDINVPVDNTQDISKETSKKVRSMPRLLLGGSGITLSDLILDIESLTDEYKTFETEITSLYTLNGIDYNNPDYILVNSFDNYKIDSFVNAYEKGIELDGKYQLLLEKINEYLKENEETQELTDAINGINDYYNKLNKDNMMNNYSNVVYNANVTDEEIVETLLGFTSLDSLSEEYEYLINAKYSFYPVSLNDESEYSIEVSGEYLIINGTSNIEKDAFNNNIKYREKCAFELKGENTIIDSKNTLDLYDKNNNLLRTLNLVIKNDVNGDGLIDDKDIDSLRSKLLKDEFSESEKIVSDINDDGVINTVDLVLLDTLVNNKSAQGNTTEALFDVVVTEKDDIVVYEVYLKTDGIVRGFEFSLKNSTNLKILSITSAGGVVFQNNNSNIKAIGLGEYTDNTLLMTVTYEKLNSDIDSELIIDNGILAFDNNSSVTNERVSKVIPAVVTEEVNDEVIVTKTVNVVPEKENNTSSNLVNIQNDDTTSEDKKDDVKRESIITGEDLDEEDIIWGNIIKIALIVLLGALIIYFLNKDTEEEKKEFLKEEDNKKEESKKEIKENKEVKEENKTSNNNNHNNNKDSNILFKYFHT